MADTLRVNASDELPLISIYDFHCDFHPPAEHMTKLRNFTKGEILGFSAFPFFHLN